MQFQVARLQEIISKIQFNCKLNFKNAVDVQLLLEADGLDLVDINNLISAGVKILGFKNLSQWREIAELLLPVRKRFIGELRETEMIDILKNFDLLESIVSLEQAEAISRINALDGKVSQILMRINVINEDRKYGFLPGEMIEKFLALSKIGGIRVKGLASFIPPFNKKVKIKRALRKLKVLFTLMQQNYRGIEIFSLNLHNNIEDLVAEGVTEIRIGINNLKSN